MRPLFPTGAEVEFDYHDRRRVGVIDTIGEGPSGAVLTLCLDNGEYKSFSVRKIRNLRVRGTPAGV